MIWEYSSLKIVELEEVMKMLFLRLIHLCEGATYYVFIMC